MTPKEFKQVVDRQLGVCMNTLVKREERYSDYNDRLHNFKQAAYLNVALPEQSLWGMVSKQIVALSDEVRRAECREDINELRSMEYITDIINYMLLLRALISETNSTSEDEEQL